VEVRVVRLWLLRALIWLLFQAATNLGALSAAALTIFLAGIRALERLGRLQRVRARGGVVLASGGFIYNRQMVREHVPRAAKAMRLGTVACDGSGIQMARRLGAAVGKMGRSAVWLFFAPPRAYLKGIFLDRAGRRICNEEYYGATLSMHMMERHEARGILLLDRRIYEEARGELWPLRSSPYQLIFGLISTFFNRSRAASLERLARKCGVPAGALEQAVARYNEGVDAGRDELGKSQKMLQRLERPPYYAINCDIDNWRFFSPAITLGGLVTDGLGARVLDGQGRPIPGLYAAGRAAVGICSQSYVTGLAIADCIFSGRNAGRAAAAAARDAAPGAAA
jgi:3-oxo-5alpha-steroid 4-dehydrogenase